MRPTVMVIIILAALVMTVQHVGIQMILIVIVKPGILVEQKMLIQVVVIRYYYIPCLILSEISAYFDHAAVLGKITFRHGKIHAV